VLSAGGPVIRVASYQATYPATGGVGNYTVSRGDAYGISKALVINLSGRSNGQVVTVDMKNQKVYVGAVETALYVSGDFFDLSASVSSIIYSDFTGTVGAAGNVLSWQPAWSY